MIEHRRSYSQLFCMLITFSTTVLRARMALKGSSYSITERRVPELIPVLGSQRARDVSH